MKIQELPIKPNKGKVAYCDNVEEVCEMIKASELSSDTVCYQCTPSQCTPNSPDYSSVVYTHRSFIVEKLKGMKNARPELSISDKEAIKCISHEMGRNKF